MGRAGVVAIVILSALVSAAGPAGAATSAAVPRSQDQPRSTWVHPGSGPLDGLGTFVYVDAPRAGPTQGSPLAYEYTVSFRLENGSSGVLALGSRNGQRLAGFGLIPGHLVDTVPFDWAFGRIYYLLTYRIGPDLWAAWVYDWSAETWTFIAQQEAAAGTGRMLPASTTGVDYDATLAPTPAADAGTCGFYPRVDAYFFPPTGWRGSEMTTAKLQGNAVEQGECPSATTTNDGWQHYALGATA